MFWLNTIVWPTEAVRDSLAKKKKNSHTACIYESRLWYIKKKERKLFSESGTLAFTIISFYIDVVKTTITRRMHLMAQSESVVCVLKSSGRIIRLLRRSADRYMYFSNLISWNMECISYQGNYIVEITKRDIDDDDDYCICTVDIMMLPRFYVRE